MNSQEMSEYSNGKKNIFMNELLLGKLKNISGIKQLDEMIYTVFHLTVSVL